VENNLVEGILKVCKKLNDSSGRPAEKPDLDFWYNSTYDNYFKLLDALEGLGQDVADFRAEQTPNPKKSFFRFEPAEFTLDFLPEMPGLGKFRSSYNNREISKIDEVEIPFIEYNDLILNKEALARPKDIEDIRQLKAIRKA
jgi:hypothetical protein